MFIYIQICNCILNFRKDDLCCVNLIFGKVFCDINFGMLLFERHFYFNTYNIYICIYNIYLNCNYIVSFSGFDIGGCLLDCSL